MKNLFIYLAFAIVTTFSLSSCSDANDEMDVVNTASDIELSSRSATAPGDSSIASIAISNGFDELVSALSFVDAELDSGLVDLFLNGKDQYTVFAPANEAFYRLYGALGVDAINEVDPELVLQVLLYHVTDGRRIAKSVVPKKNYKVIETLQGSSFMVDSSGQILANTAVENKASIAASDISASNGIIHVISEVILP